MLSKEYESKVKAWATVLLLSFQTRLRKNTSKRRVIFHGQGSSKSHR
ncbi:hypothetical protein LBKG_01521 [Lactobacillus crispatus CTV-05]|nr:hypothetical protein LBKG_01521 [Lactobacillus crispatus CTV-05]